MNKNKRINYLAIAITTNCNCNCFYCKPTGESILPNIKGTLNFKSLRKIIKVAYELGITTFRITGGEPTTVSYLSSLMRYIMELGDNTKIRLNTNGYKLYNKELLNIIERYKERMDIVISVDSVNEYIEGIHYPKYLSAKIQNLATELVNRKIPTRFNVVVTKRNISEIKELINKSIALGVNVKILDLIIQNEYFGTNKDLNGEEAVMFGKAEYVSLENIVEYLEIISDRSKEKYHMWNSFGIPRSGYFIGEQWIQVKDSSKGAEYSKTCIEGCPYYDSCNEGLFSPFISVGEILHLSGCKNKDWYYTLKGKSEAEIKKALDEILTLFENTELRKH
jgi:molybdenum cofactor biosynthesis enzyme MoaA